MKRKFKVTTSITNYYWANSREDAAKFQEELISRQQFTFEKNAKTNAKFCYNALSELIETPEDISQTRDPRNKLMVGDWLEVSGSDQDLYAIVRKVTRDKVHYLEASTKIERSVDKDLWKRWCKFHTIHPRYEEILPPPIIDRAIEIHRERGLLSGMGAGGDSAVILDVLAEYAFFPDDWELENGYWAERLIDEAIGEFIEKQRDQTPDHRDPEEQDMGGVAFSDKIPTIDDFNNW